MKHKQFIVLFLLLGSACQGDRLPEDLGGTGDSSECAIDTSVTLKGWVRVKFKMLQEDIQPLSTRGDMETGIENLDSVARMMGARMMRRVFPPAGRFEAKHRQAGLHLWYDLYFDESIPVSRATSHFRSVPEIQVVEPIYKIKQVGTCRFVQMSEKEVVVSRSIPFNDPLLSKQWHYDNTGDLLHSIAGADINLFRAWNVTQGSPNVVVAIVDGGIDCDHEDLKNSIAINEIEKQGVAGVDDDGNGYKDDIYGWNFVTGSPVLEPTLHGTHVAGTVAAENDNKTGGCGVAGGTRSNPGVRLVSCQISRTNPSTGKDQFCPNVEAAIVYGADRGAVISQNSWGYEVGALVLPQAVKEAIDYFIKEAGTDEQGNQTGPMKGGIVFFAAGNDDRNVKIYPSSYEKVIAVSAFAPDLKKASYSNYADWIDMAAPGGDDYENGAAFKEYMVLSTGLNNKYYYMVGTSMATPHLSGIAALVISKFQREGLLPEEVRSRLELGCRDIDQYNPVYKGKLGLGYIDAYVALGMDASQPPVITRVDAGEFSIPYNQVRDIVYHVADPDDDSVACFVVDPSDLITLRQVGNTVTLSIRNKNYSPGRYTTTIKAVDDMRATSFESIAFTLEANHSPVLKRSFENLYFGNSGSSQTVDLQLFFKEMDNEELCYTFEYDRSLLALNLESDVLTITSRSYGLSAVTVIASDESDLSCSGKFSVMSRDDTQEIDVYPNPVKDNLHIRLGEGFDGEIIVKFYNSAGRLVLSSQTTASPFRPGMLNVSKLSGGVYVAVIELPGKTIKRNIIKL